MTWKEICDNEEFQGRWVALGDCTFDDETGEATEGEVVDVDENLVELCERLRAAEKGHCQILFAEVS
ncbi:MAG: hypothetical protein AAGF12_32595 [Myxococcota bacterium]